jgi:hypothetical protein
MTAIYDELLHGWEHVTAHLPHHARDAYPETTTTPTTEDPPMATTDTLAAIKDAAEQGASWLKQITEQHLPSLAADLEKYQGNLIVQALEGIVLPPAAEAQIASLIKFVAGLASQPDATPAAPAADAALGDESAA